MTTADAQNGSSDGQFWLADSPDVVLQGRLDLDACELELAAPLVSPWESSTSSSVSVSHERQDAEVRYRVHGRLADGRAVTLPQATRFPGVFASSQKFSDLRVLLGWVDGDPKDAPIDTLRLGYGPEVAEWLRQSAGIKLSVPLDDAPELSITIDDDGGLHLSGVPEWTLQQCTDYLLMPMAGLIALLTHRAPTGLWQLKYVTSGTTVNVLRRSSERRAGRPVREYIARLHYDDASNWVNGWLSMTRRLRPSYLMALSAFGAGTVEYKIFTMAAALERFHGKMQPKISVMTKEDRNEAVKAAVDAVPGEYAERVEGILKNYLGQPSFMHRLHATVATMPESFANGVCGVLRDDGGPREVWARAVKDARNAAAHASGMDELVDFESEVARLAVLAESLMFVVSAVYLTAAGMSADKVEHRLRGLSHYHLMADRLRMRWPEIYAYEDLGVVAPGSGEP